MATRLGRCHRFLPAEITTLAQAVALSDNAHTRLYLVRNRTAVRRYPIRVWWFREGLFVVKTRPEFSDLLGVRVVRINGVDVMRLKAQVAPLFAGNTGWRDYMSTYSLTSPDLLAGLHLIPDSGTTEMEFVARDGKRFRRLIRPLPLQRLGQPTEAWWDLSPLHTGNAGPWASPLPQSPDSLPLYLQRPESWYWSAEVPDAQLLYLQVNRAGNEPGRQSLSAFMSAAMERLQSGAIRKVAFDLRFNTGGDLTVAFGLLQQFAKLPIAQRPGGTFVVIGRATFSAGVTHAAQLKQDTKAVLVGEPVGEVLDFWSEGGNLTLPNSRDAVVLRHRIVKRSKSA